MRNKSKNNNNNNMSDDYESEEDEDSEQGGNTNNIGRNKNKGLNKKSKGARNKKNLKSKKKKYFKSHSCNIPSINKLSSREGVKLLTDSFNIKRNNLNISFDAIDRRKSLTNVVNPQKPKKI